MMSSADLFLPAASVGIIGGADGPTAIFVASAVNPWAVAAAVAAVLAAVFILYRKKKK